MKKSIVNIVVSTVMLASSAAFAESAVPAWKTNLKLITNPVALRKVQTLLDGPNSKVPNLNNPQEVKQFADRLLERTNELADIDYANADLGGVSTLVQYKNGALRFYDFAVEPVAPTQPERKSIVIPETRSLKAWGVERMKLEDFGADKFLSDKISAWDKSSIFLPGVLKRAVRNLPVYVFDYEITFQNNKQIPASLRAQPVDGIVTGAIYLKDYGVLISKKYFERLKFDDQMGLLMREVLHHVQLTYGFGNSEASLHKLTIALMNGPKAGESLDSSRVIDGDFMHSILVQARTEAATLYGVPEFCAVAAEVMHIQCGINEVDYAHVSQLHDMADKGFKYFNNNMTAPEAGRVLNAGNYLVLIASDLIMGQVSVLVDTTNEFGKAVTDKGTLDVISKDFNESRSPRYKKQAAQIIDGLKKANVIR